MVGVLTQQLIISSPGYGSEIPAGNLASCLSLFGKLASLLAALFDFFEQEGTAVIVRRTHPTENTRPETYPM